MVARAKRTKPAQSDEALIEAQTSTVEAPTAALAAGAEIAEEAADASTSAVEDVAASAETVGETVPEAKAAVSASAEAAIETAQGQAGRLVEATRSAYGFWLTWWPEQISDNIRTTQALARCRSLAEVVEIQRSFVGSAIERWNRLAG